MDWLQQVNKSVNIHPKSKEEVARSTIVKIMNLLDNEIKEDQWLRETVIYHCQLLLDKQRYG